MVTTAAHVCVTICILSQTPFGNKPRLKIEMHWCAFCKFAAPNPHCAILKATELHVKTFFSSPLCCHRVWHCRV